MHEISRDASGQHSYHINMHASSVEAIQATGYPNHGITCINQMDVAQSTYISDYHHGYNIRIDNCINCMEKRDEQFKFFNGQAQPSTVEWKRIGEAKNPGPFAIRTFNPGQIFGCEEIMSQWPVGIHTAAETSHTRQAMLVSKARFAKLGINSMFGPPVEKHTIILDYTEARPWVPLFALKCPCILTRLNPRR